MKSYDVAECGAPLKLFERPTPKPSGSEVLLRVLAAGVCHSDIHIWEGHYDLGGGKKLNLTDRGLKLPLTMGHETVGEVVALGPEASGVSVGDKRLVFPWLGCGSCAVCRRGEEQLCLAPRFLGVFRNGGYADHILVPHARYLLDIGDMKPAEAAKRTAALKAGALAAIDGAAPDALKQVIAAAPKGVWAVIDFVGASSTAKLAVDSLTKGGKLVVVGLFGGDITLPLPFIPMRAMTIQGSYVGSLAEAKELLALVKRTPLPPIPITTHPLETADATLQALRAGRVVGRAVLTP